MLFFEWPDIKQFYVSLANRLSSQVSIIYVAGLRISVIKTNLIPFVKRFGIKKLPSLTAVMNNQVRTKGDIGCSV